MEFSAVASDFANALALAKSSVPTRTTIPLLNNIRISTKRGGIVIGSTDTMMDAALELIDSLRSSLMASLESVGRSSYLENSNLSEEVDELVRIHAAIKAGRTDDALYDLEKVISTFDSGWRCRAA